jgi:hypothetical protein
MTLYDFLKLGSPQAEEAEAYGINNHGDAVGMIFLKSDQNYHGCIWPSGSPMAPTILPYAGPLFKIDDAGNAICFDPPAIIKGQSVVIDLAQALVEQHLVPYDLNNWNVVVGWNDTPQRLLSIIGLVSRRPGSIRWLATTELVHLGSTTSKC